MGRAKKVLDENQKQETKRLITEGKNVREIYEVLRAKHNLDMGENTLYTKITKELGFRYDKEENKWHQQKTDNACPTNTESSSHSQENNNTQNNEEAFIELKGDQESLFVEVNNDNKSVTTDKKCASQPSSPANSGISHHNIMKKLDEIYKITYDTALKVFELEKRIDNVSKKVTHIQKSNVQKKIEQYPQDFAEIFNSKSIKTSLNLNREVKTRILKLMKNHFDEKGNESKLINTALLLALFHYSGQDNFNEQ